MIAVDNIERTCTRAYRVVDTQMADEIALLRAARMLKRAHDDLRLAHWERTRSGGAHPDSTGVLQNLEQELRYILLGHEALTPAHMRARLLTVLDQSFDMIDSLRKV